MDDLPGRQEDFERIASMMKYVGSLLALLACCTCGQANSVSLNQLSNSDLSYNTAHITYNNGQQSGSNEWVYISQFQMTLTNSNGGTSTLYTYCLDLPHNEQWNIPYTVTPVSLASVFGTTNGNEIATSTAPTGPRTWQAVPEDLRQPRRRVAAGLVGPQPVQHQWRKPNADFLHLLDDQRCHHLEQRRLLFHGDRDHGRHRDRDE